MFTGLIETLGVVKSISYKGTSVVLSIMPDLKDFEVSAGDSVAIDGSCLTVEQIQGNILTFTAVRETVLRTTLKDCHAGRRVNMERSLKLGGRLDGHLVQGHVDGVGQIISDTDAGGSILRKISVPSALSPLIAEKGSVAIDGISLTIANCTDDTLTVSVIPETIKRTNMVTKRTGDMVNLECDIVSRYLFRIAQYYRASEGSAKESDSLLNKMERFGF